MSSPSRNACFSDGNVGDLGQQPQLDLRIVRRHQLVAGRRDEGAADLAAVLGAHRDVLQVRLVRRQPSGGGRRQRVGRVHAMGLRIDVGRQRVGIGRFQLRDLAPFQNLLREIVALLGEIVEHLRRGRPRAGLGLGAAGQAHLAEEDVADLLGAADIDRLARDLLDFGLDPRGGLREIARQPRQHLAVDRDAAAFHPRQHATPAAAPASRRPRSCARRRGAASARATAAGSTSASSAEYSVALSIATWSKVSLLLPLPMSSPWAIMAWPSQRLGERIEPMRSCGRHRAHRTSAARRRNCAA